MTSMAIWPGASRDPKTSMAIWSGASHAPKTSMAIKRVDHETLGRSQGKAAYVFSLARFNRSLARIINVCNTMSGRPRTVADNNARLWGERNEMHQCMAGDSHVVIKRLLEADRNRLEALQKSDWHCNQKKAGNLIRNIHIHGIIREISAYRDQHCEIPTK